VSTDLEQRRSAIRTFVCRARAPIVRSRDKASNLGRAIHAGTLVALVALSVSIPAISLAQTQSHPALQTQKNAVEPNSSQQEPRPRVENPQFIRGHQLIYPGALVQHPPSDLSSTFALLHQERKWAVDESQLLRDSLLRLTSQPHRQPISIPIMSEADYNAKVAQINDEMRKVDRDQNDMNLDERQRTAAHLQSIELIRQEARETIKFAEGQEFQRDDAEYKRWLADQETDRSDYDATIHYLSSIDDAANSLLLTTEKTSYFRLFMGLGFMILTGGIIAGFFILAKPGNIRTVLFTNDRGLQFITLFSLVIAIILFGLLNILEGRELSALLGGLSGYILGRSNLGFSATRGTSEEKPNSNAESMNVGGTQSGS
jgi:hypothetical protein